MQLKKYFAELIGTMTLVVLGCGAAIATQCGRYPGSLGPALFAGGAALKNLWVFLVAPLVGGAIAAGVHRYLGVEEKKKKK